MQNPLVDLYRNSMQTAADVARLSLENSIRLQEQQLAIVRGIVDFWSSVWHVQRFTRSSEDVARAAANEVSRAAGSVRESGNAANQERKAERNRA